MLRSSRVEQHARAGMRCRGLRLGSIGWVSWLPFLRLLFSKRACCVFSRHRANSTRRQYRLRVPPLFCARSCAARNRSASLRCRFCHRAWSMILLVTYTFRACRLYTRCDLASTSYARVIPLYHTTLYADQTRHACASTGTCLSHSYCTAMPRTSSAACHPAIPHCRCAPIQHWMEHYSPVSLPRCTAPAWIAFTPHFHRFAARLLCAFTPACVCHRSGRIVLPVPPLLLRYLTMHRLPLPPHHVRSASTLGPIYGCACFHNWTLLVASYLLAARSAYSAGTRPRYHAAD